MKKIFLAWFYGVPLLLIPGIVRHLDDSGRLQHANGPTGDVLVGAALLCAVGLPAAGLALAWHRRDRRWLAHHGAAAVLGVALTAAILVLTAAVRQPEPPTAPTPPNHCQPVSGGRGCPGG